MNAPSLSGMHAVVTGASRGIGAAIAQALARRGATLSLFARSKDSLAATLAALGSVKAQAIAADVADLASVQAAFASARAGFGPVRILVNNAGQARSAAIQQADDALWDEMLNVNLTGTYRCIRAVLPDMLSGGSGRIVNIASTAGLIGYPYVSAYCASKHGVIGLTRALALELARKGITVNAVCPGYTDTEIVRESIENIRTKTGRSKEEALAALVKANPQGRLILPEEVAEAVAWLCQPGSGSITGQSIAVAGGEVM